MTPDHQPSQFQYSRSSGDLSKVTDIGYSLTIKIGWKECGDMDHEDESVDILLHISSTKQGKRKNFRRTYSSGRKRATKIRRSFCKKQLIHKIYGSLLQCPEYTSRVEVSRTRRVKPHTPASLSSLVFMTPTSQGQESGAVFSGPQGCSVSTLC